VERIGSGEIDGAKIFLRMIICCDVSFTRSDDDSQWRLWIYQGMPKLIWACRRVEIGWPTKALCGVMCGILMLLWVCNAICVIWRHWAILVFSSWCVALGALRWKNGLGRRATQSRAKFVETLFLLWPMVLKNNAKQ
jgi:hypothetical protein